MNVPPEQLRLAAPPRSSWIVPGRSVKPIQSFWNHRRLAITIALPIFLLGLAVALLFGHAKYRATASVRVLPTYDTRLLTGLDPSVIPNLEYRNFVQQQVFEVDNPETIVEALKLLGPRASLWQRPDESTQHAAERLMDYLKVEWVPDTFLITVSLEGGKPVGLDEIVNAVVNAYLTRQERQDLSGADVRGNLLAQRRTSLQQQADAERAQLSQLAQELGVSTFAAGDSDPYNRTLADANEALARQRRELIVEQANLSALQAQQDHPSDADLNAVAQKILLGNPDLATQKADLEKQREAAFLQLQGLAATHPGRQILEQQVADIDKELSHIDGKAMAQARSMVLGNHSADTRAKIAEAQVRVDQAQRARDGIEQEVATLKTSVASFGVKYNQALSLHEQFESHDKAISEIDDRIELLRLQRQSPGVASLELPAQLPDKPEGGKRTIISVFFMFLAALFGVGVPVAIDLTDSRVKSSHELETILQMPVLGSTLKGDALYSRETLRRISLSIMRERRQGGTRVFVITAVGEKAGTSSLTLALSNELTELGASAVALEANALHPDIRYQNGPATNGYSYSNGSAHVNGAGSDSAGHGAVAKLNSFDVCVHKIINASASLPDRMAICQRQRHARLAMKCVQESLELALAGHDLVLMDAPPVLGSADTAMLVQNPAGVIVVVRAERDRLDDVTAAIQELNKLSPPVVGVVMQRDPIVDMGVSPHSEIKYGELQIRSARRAPVVPASTVS
jgi:polysaccharide biosynthesis transport protein